MIDRFILPLQRKLLAPLAARFVARGVRADQISLAGFAIGLLAVPAIASGAYVFGLVLILLNRLADGLDGAVARQTLATDRGAFLDIALDFVFYATVPLAFALANPEHNALAAAVLITSFVGTGSSFLAFAVIAAKRGLTADAYPAKGLYYLGGLTEGGETIALFTAFCLFPQSFPVLAYGFAALCLITTLTRWHQGWRAFQAP
jgi:phosphatidylglycerophosphate synthase